MYILSYSVAFFNFILHALCAMAVTFFTTVCVYGLVVRYLYTMVADELDLKGLNYTIMTVL